MLDKLAWRRGGGRVSQEEGPHLAAGLELLLVDVQQAVLLDDVDYHEVNQRHGRNQGVDSRKHQPEQDHHCVPWHLQIPNSSTTEAQRRNVVYPHVNRGCKALYRWVKYCSGHLRIMKGADFTCSILYSSAAAS